MLPKPLSKFLIDLNIERGPENRNLAMNGLTCAVISDWKIIKACQKQKVGSIITTAH